VTRSTFVTILFGAVWCAGLHSPAKSQEQSVDQALQVLRAVHAEKLSESDKKSKAVELQLAWETLEKGGPGAITALHQAIAEDRQKSTKDDSFALAAAALLWKIGGVAEADEIARIWQTSQQTINYNYVFGTAIMAAHTRDQRVLPMLRALLHEKEGHLGVPQHAMTLAWPESMQIVWEMFGSGGLSSLEDVLEHSKNPAEIETAMLLLVRAEHIRVLPTVRQLAKHHNPEVKGMAIQCLGVFGHPQDYELLAAGLTSGDTQYRAAYLAALGQYGDPKATALVARHLDSNDTSVRQIAMQTLMDLPSPISLDAIRKREGVAFDAEEKEACKIGITRLSGFIGITWERYSTISPAEQQRLFDVARKKLE